MLSDTFTIKEKERMTSDVIGTKHQWLQLR